MRIQYNPEEAEIVLKQMARAYLRGYEITEIRYDKWDGLTIEATREEETGTPALPPCAPSSVDSPEQDIF